MTTAEPSTVARLRDELLMALWGVSRAQLADMAEHTGLAVFVVCRCCGEAATTDFDVTEGKFLEHWPPYPWIEMRHGEFCCSERCYDQMK